MSKVLFRYLRFCTADCLLCDSKCSSFPAVFQVVGVKDERMGEEICACIKLVDGADCTAEEIKAYCKGQVGHSSRLIFHNELELCCTIMSAVHLLLSDLPLQDSSLRTFCNQLPTHDHWKGNFLSPGSSTEFIKSRNFFQDSYKWHKLISRFNKMSFILSEKHLYLAAAVTVCNNLGEGEIQDENTNSPLVLVFLSWDAI